MINNNLIVNFLCLATFTFGTSCTEVQHKEYKKGAFVEIIESEALQLIDPNAKIEILASGFEWTEGPLWVEDGEFLLFSDIPNNRVHKIDNQGNLSVYLSPSGYTEDIPRGGEMGSNALLLDKEHNLILLQHGDRMVAKMNATLDEPKSIFEAIASEYKGQKLNSPNDGVFDADGNLYFTDPPYGLEKLENDPTKELSFQGLYFADSSGKIVLLDSTISKPNGVILNPDEKKLLVAVSDPKHAVWYQYDIIKPGTLSNKQVFYDATALVGLEGEQGLPDGMKMKSGGYLFATGPGGVLIFNTDAQPIAKIRTGENTSNCAFSTDEKRLFITADDYIFSIDLL